MSDRDYDVSNAIAIVGMAGRFPGAGSITELWTNLCNGTESIRPFTPEELAASGVTEEMLKNPDYVNAGAPLDAADCFDAGFFGYLPREAELMDPQQRIFLECAWSALEDAGYDSAQYDGDIGVFGGIARNTYLLRNAATYSQLMASGATYDATLGSDKDYAATRVAYQLNLNGPAMSIQTACSSSGVAVHVASQALLNGECDMALAGGARVQVPLTAGYQWVEGGIPSPDGHCRPFDKDANGTVYGSGVAIVVLKRLEDALDSRDHIYSVILGSAINNDGAEKVGFTAPSIRGQAAVIESALGMAGVSAESIGYVESHGTGTSLGDPIEVAALTNAYRKQTDRNGYCAIGSLKSNIGHLDAGAGVAGLIKTSLMLHHKKLVPSLNFQDPNPQLDLENSPFYVSTSTQDWQAGTEPRRAAISAFGLGGTNFHLVLEEAPEALVPTTASTSWHPLFQSAKSSEALDAISDNLANVLDGAPDIDLDDISYTLAVGRSALSMRRVTVARTVDEAASSLRSRQASHTVSGVAGSPPGSVAFLFSGQGAQYTGMGRDLYEEEPVFRDVVDQCCAALEGQLDADLKEIVFGGPHGNDKKDDLLNETRYTQPGLFVLEYALAKLWMSKGITPDAVAGHSLGEIVAACIAGVFDLDDALKIVVERGKLMQSMKPGDMLAISLAEENVRDRLPKNIELASINTSTLCVVSGTAQEIAKMHKELEADSIQSTVLNTSHAFHSKMMEPALEPFRKIVASINLRPPQIPIVSNVTGDWLTEEQATDPGYWSSHIRSAVRMSDCIGKLLEDQSRALIELGPGNTLCSFVRRHPAYTKDHAVVQSVRHPTIENNDAAIFHLALGQLWCAGYPLDWQRIYPRDDYNRVSLPTYPFERKRFWLKAQAESKIVEDASDAVFEECLAGPKLAEPTPGDAAGCSRQELIVIELCSVLEELSGIPKEDLDIDASFVEMGFDSLFLTRANSEFKKACGVDIGFRQLFDEAPSISALANYVDNALPEDSEKFRPTSVVPAQDEPTPGDAAGCSRQELIVIELCSVLEELSGIPKEDLDIDASFVEMGFDSLFLTRANSEFKKACGVDIGFRQLFDEAPSISALANYVDNVLPEDSEKFRPTSVVPAQDEVGGKLVAMPTSNADDVNMSMQSLIEKISKGGEGFERVISHQIQVIQGQLELLGSIRISEPTSVSKNLLDHDSCLLPGQKQRSEIVPSSNLGETSEDAYKTIKLTESQSEIWLAATLNDDASRCFNVTNILRLFGSLDVECLQLAIQKLVDRHQALRTKIIGDGSGQTIGHRVRVSIPTHDFSDLALPERNRQLEQLFEESAVTPFDLEEAPLFRPQIVTLSKDEHVVLLTVHHIICDGWSTGVLMRELGVLYKNEKQGASTDSLPEHQLSDFVDLSSSTMFLEGLKKSQEFWLNKLSGPLPVLSLPTDRDRGHSRTFNAGRVEVELDAGVITGIRELGRKNNSTFFNTLLSSYVVYLHRISQQNSLIIGISAAQQPSIGMPGLISHCVSMLPLRFDLDPNLTFSDLLKITRNVVLDAFDHQDCSYGRLIPHLNIDRSSGRPPLISTAFTLDPSMLDIEFDDLQVRVSSAPRRFEIFELFFTIVETTEGARIECTYNADLFDQDTIASRLAGFGKLLSSICQDDQCKIQHLDFCSDDDIEIIRHANSTFVDYGTNNTIFDAITHHVSDSDRPAIEFEGVETSYGSLQQQTSQLANFLNSAGVEPGSLVGIHMERSSEMLVAMLGVMKAGCAYLPLDPGFPAQRLEYMLSDSGTQVLITQESLVGVLPDFTGQTIAVDLDAEAIGACPTSAPEFELDPHALAYVLYTSGSTGRPKGVMVPHSGVINFFSSMAREPGLSAEDTLVAVTTTSFDISVLELFLPLTVGAKVVIASSENAADGAGLKSLLERSNATVMQATPTTWRMLLDEGWKGGQAFKVLCGGEPLPQDLARELIPVCGELWNLYGPTETTIWSSCAQIMDADAPITIGRPIANTQIYVLDDNQQLQPIGVPGELCIAGAGVSLGYMNQPALTSSVFIPSPLSDEPGARLYRTGDLARWRNDGTLQHLGRIDEQVKIRGFRIELGEIESVLTEHDSVKAVACNVWQAAPDDHRLVAYIVPSDEQTIVPTELRKHLRGKVPDYMVPQYFEQIDSIPLTANGKMDRANLPDFAVGVEEFGKPPTTNTEKHIAELWVQLLGVPNIFKTSDFFALGGHSILAVKLITTIRKELSGSVPLVTIFDHSILSDFCSELEELGFSWDKSEKREILRL